MFEITWQTGLPLLLRCEGTSSGAGPGMTDLELGVSPFLRCPAPPLSRQQVRNTNAAGQSSYGATDLPACPAGAQRPGPRAVPVLWQM